MSSTAASGPQVPTSEKPKSGLSKYVAKFKKALKSNDSSKRLSVSRNSQITTAPEVPQSSTAVAIPETIAEDVPETQAPEIKTYSRAQLDAERTKRLGERFRLSIAPEEWTIPPVKDMEVKRIEKPIRMRVHRTCHKCGTSFGANKNCAGCEHARCTKCPRYPGKKSDKKAKEVAVATAPVAASAPAEEDVETLKMEFLLTIPSKTGGQPLVRKKPRQRVRRNCHACSMLFTAGSKECSGCGHIRCEDCPRDPAKKAKYPYGYPGDAPSSTKPKRFVCSDCSINFELPVESPEESPACTGCGKSSSKRVKPRKITPAPDPEVLKSLEAKLAALRVS